MSWNHPLWSWRTRPLRFFVVIFVLALGAAAAERLAASLRTRFLESGNGASWIWAAGDYGDGRPAAFYAVRELWLERPVRTRISIVADETYLLYVNGQRVGAGSYRAGAPVDEYEVGHLLETGLNRFLVELHSSRGAGGLLAKMEIGEHDPLVIGTDDRWRIFRRHDPSLFGGWSPLEGGEAATVWQRPPTGHWRLGKDRRRRQIPFQALTLPRRRPVRFQVYKSGLWRDLSWTRRRIPAIGPQQLYDFGEQVVGYLSFDLTSSDGRPALLFFDSQPPDPNLRAPDEVLLAVPGRLEWEDAFPRRFRYLLVIGAEPYSRMEVALVDPDLARQLAPPENHNGGVFGLDPPRSYSKVEEDVWDGLTGRAGKRRRPERSTGRS